MVTGYNKAVELTVRIREDQAHMPIWPLLLLLTILLAVVSKNLRWADSPDPAIRKIENIRSSAI